MQTARSSYYVPLMNDTDAAWDRCFFFFLKRHGIDVWAAQDTHSYTYGAGMRSPSQSPRHHRTRRCMLHGHELMIELPAAALIHSTSSFGCHDGEAEESERLWTICIDTAVGSGGELAPLLAGAQQEDSSAHA